MAKEHFPYIFIVAVVAVVAVVVLLLSLRTTVKAPAAEVAEEASEEALAGEAIKMGMNSVSQRGLIKLKKCLTVYEWDKPSCRGVSCTKEDGGSGVVVWSYTDRSEPSLLGIGCCAATDCVNGVTCSSKGSISTPDVPQLYCASKNKWTFCEDTIAGQASEDGMYTCKQVGDYGDYLWVKAG